MDLSKKRGGAKGEGKVFASCKEVHIAYDAEEIDIQAKIFVRINGELTETTVGRTLLFEITPKEIPFSAVNELMSKKVLTNLVNEAFLKAGREKTVIFLDDLKELGFKYSTKGGITFSIDYLRMQLGNGG